MRYIFKRTNFLIEKITWIDTKKQEWDTEFTQLIMSFHSVILEMIDELKDKFNDKDDSEEVYKMYVEYIESAFESLSQSIRRVTNDDDLQKLWNELNLNFYLWKDTFKKMSEKLDNYNSIFKLGYDIFNKITSYNTKKILSEFYDSIKEGDIDDKRENAINYIDEYYKEIKLRLEDIDPEDVFSMSNLDEKDTEEISFDAGDEVRYYKNDGEENIAIISHNQENLENKSDLRLVSKETGEQFTIDKSELIEIIPKHKTLNQEISDKLKAIKKDTNKLEELDNYLSKLNKKNEAMDLNKIFEDINANKELTLEDVKITTYKTKIWMSNYKFKNTHIKYINKFLQEVYEPIGYWKKYQQWGVMDLPWEKERWSILNKINTNWMALPIMINEINRSLKEGNSKIELFNFNKVKFDSKQFWNEYFRMMKFINKFKKQIFLKLSEDSGSKTLNEMIKVINKTSRSGDIAEIIVKKYIPSIFKDATNIEIPKGYGENQDMIDGIDLTFYMNNERKTVQVKKCETIFKTSDGNIQVIGTSFSKHYTVDYLACVTKTDLVIFKYDASNIIILSEGDLKINSNLIVGSLKV